MEYVLYTVLLAVALFVGGGALFVGLTYLFWFYEESNRLADELAGKGPSDEFSLDDAIECTFGRAGGTLPVVMATEWFRGMWAAVLYPFGMRDKKPLQIDFDIASATETPPVVMVHGYTMNRSNFFVLKVRLEHDFGLHFVECINLKPMFASIPELAELFMRKLDELAVAYKVEKFQVVAHSMGGIIARYAAAYMGGAARMERLITLGTPHRGTKLAVFAIGENAKSLHPTSSLLRTLQAEERLHKERIVPVVAIASRHDNMLLPFDSGLWQNAKANLVVSGIGHMGLLFDPRVSWIVGALLTMPKWERKHLEAVALPDGFKWQFFEQGIENDSKQDNNRDRKE